MLASVLHFYSGQPLQNLSGVDKRENPVGLLSEELDVLRP